MVEKILLIISTILGIITVGMVSLAAFLTAINFINGESMTPSDKLGLFIIFSFLILPLMIMGVMEIKIRRDRD